MKTYLIEVWFTDGHMMTLWQEGKTLGRALERVGKLPDAWKTHDETDYYSSWKGIR